MDEDFGAKFVIPQGETRGQERRQAEKEGSRSVSGICNATDLGNLHLGRYAFVVQGTQFSAFRITYLLL